jgi:hypothetical protein
MNRNQAMKTKGRTGAVEGQPLVTKCRRNPTGTKQRGQQMALGVAEACTMPEHIGRDASNNRNPVVRTVSHMIAHPEKASPCYLLIAGCIASELGCCGNDGSRVTVNDRCGLEKLTHVSKPPVFRPQGGRAASKYELPLG